LLKGNHDLVDSKDDEQSATPLYCAAAAGHKAMVELLLANKADIGDEDEDCWTPLHVAAAKDHKDVVELLRKHGGHE